MKHLYPYQNGIICRFPNQMVLKFLPCGKFEVFVLIQNGKKMKCWNCPDHRNSLFWQAQLGIFLLCFPNWLASCTGSGIFVLSSV